MKAYPAGIKFKYEWRHYQARVLNNLERHLNDNHLHIIAPPGSGKTVLGLEVALRLNKPTLILAPTVAIRNQWIQRFCELFLRANTVPDWISQDIKAPRFLTVATYQALHAACSNTSIEEDSLYEEAHENITEGKPKKAIDTKKIVSQLKQQGVKTMLVDETHHLKNEWWKSLTAVKSALQPTIVGLTATPPYDVTYKEWQRYLDLNGPIDAEISVPELLIEGNLCPHQDYIYLSKPTEEENTLITEQRAKAFRLFEAIKTDEVLIQAIMCHPIYQYPSQDLESTYSNLKYYAAMLIFLHAAGHDITKKHLEIIGDKHYQIPPLNFEWIEILLSFYLFDDKENFNAYETHKASLINKLKRNGLIDRKTISFKHHQSITRSLKTSLSKLKSIDNIVDIEHNTLGSQLRMVILTDYIRKEFLVHDTKNTLLLNKIGVMPIFEQLRRSNDRGMKIGVLSGSLIIIPVSALQALEQAAHQLHIHSIAHSPLAYDKDFVIIHPHNKLKQQIVQLVTNIFEAGEIEVLIGTKSLLGEGWDAPTINALILASFVGSYVLSNQMRGRAIRAHISNANKTSNIWHLACIDPSAQDGGDDLLLMKRRFKSFVGVSHDDNSTIENGINRLNLPNTFTPDDIAAYTTKTVQQASTREALKQKWTDALAHGVELIEEIKVPFPPGSSYERTKSLYYNKTIANLFGVLGSGLLGFAGKMLEGLGKHAKHIHSREDIFRWLLFIGIAGVVFFGQQMYHTLRLFFKYRDISKDIQQIGEALLLSLVKTGHIQTDTSTLEVVSSMDKHGAIYCHLKGGTSYEQSTFIKSLQEIVSSIHNPRYLILRKSLFLKVFSQSDYHAVPELIGRNKKNAEYFEEQWRQIVGACDLIYTRSLQGRKILLSSRIHSLSSEFEEHTERLNTWR